MHPDMSDYAELVRRARTDKPADWQCAAAPCSICGTTGDCRLPSPGPLRDAWLEGRRSAIRDQGRDA